MADNSMIRSTEDQGAAGAVPSAAGMLGVVQGMMGAMQGQTVAPSFTPTAPGQLMQSSESAGGDNSVSVGADPNAHTSQAYDPATNTLITTTVDPTTGATTTTMTSSTTTFGGTAMAGSRVGGAGGGVADNDPPQTARVTEVVDDEAEVGDQEDEV